MEHGIRPLLSIGVIYKNEIRCLERCVKSLQKLRETIPCELVMADTGSDDGSREIAEKYADILFDFPWINDFSAARNAVMDRCSGEWFFSIDADEWLDKNIFELTAFLSNRKNWRYPFCGLIIRNYQTPELDEEFSDFLGVRLCQMSTNMRYTGAIHERWDYSGTVDGLGHTILHHDGYVKMNEEKSREKRERNLQLLQKKLAQDPNDLKTILQCVESAKEDPLYEQYIRDAIIAVEKRYPHWEHCGPPIFRYAVQLAAIAKLPELEAWAARAQELFPESPYTTVDITYLMFIHYAEQADYTQAIPLGEQYLQNLADYHAKKFNPAAMMVSTVVMATAHREDRARAILADAYFQTGQPQLAKDMLLSIDRNRMKPDAVDTYMRILMNLYAENSEDLSEVVEDLWNAINYSKDNEKLKAAFINISATAFSTECLAAADKKGYAHIYRLFLPLSGKCGLGTAAEILESDNAARMEELLTTVDDWEELPIVALERALLFGASLPAGLRLEDMDVLAERLSRTCSQFSSLLDDAVHAMDKDFPSLLWARGMALAAVSAENWENGESGLQTARVFSDVERTFLPRYYTADFLTDEKIQFLPPMHRFGWYCAQAFDALDGGDTAGYVRCLRKGLSACESMKPVVECLLKQLEDQQQNQAASELLLLAQQVRMMLSQYAPGSPIVEEIRRSAAYQRVKHLIEGSEISLVPKEETLL